MFFSSRSVLPNLMLVLHNEGVVAVAAPFNVVVQR